MSENLTWVWFEGQEGITRRGRLSDASGRVDLDGYSSVKVQVSAKPSSALLLDATVTADDQSTDNGATGTTGKGWFTYQIDATAAAIPARAEPYYLSFVGLNGTVPTYYPLNKQLKRTYGQLIVHDPLGV